MSCLERDVSAFIKMAPKSQLTEEQVEKLKTEFLSLDVDGDGTITIEELAKILRSMKRKLAISDNDIERTLKDIDQDGDGTIDLEEYLKRQKQKTKKDILHRALLTRSRIRKEFEKYDKDQSGYVSPDELMSVIQARVGFTVTLEQTEKIIQDKDKDSDGKIDYEEFVLLMIS